MGKAEPKSAAEIIQRGLNGMADEPSVKVVVPSEKRRAFHCLLLQLQKQHANGTAERKKAVSDFITRWKLTTSLRQSTTPSGSTSPCISHGTSSPKNKKRAVSDPGEPQHTLSPGSRRAKFS